MVHEQIFPHKYETSVCLAPPQQHYSRVIVTVPFLLNSPTVSQSLEAMNYIKGFKLRGKNTLNHIKLSDVFSKADRYRLYELVHLQAVFTCYHQLTDLDRSNNSSWPSLS